MYAPAAGLLAQNLAEHRNLSIYHLSAGSSNGLAPLHTCFEVEDVMNVVCEVIV